MNLRLKGFIQANILSDKDFQHELEIVSRIKKKCACCNIETINLCETVREASKCVLNKNKKNGQNQGTSIMVQ